MWTDAVQGGVESAHAGAEENVSREERLREREGMTREDDSMLAGSIVSNNAVGFSKMCEVRKEKEMRRG